MSHPTKAPAFVAAGVALVLWGGTAIANKIAVGFMDALTAGVLRSMLAGLFAVVIALLLRLPLPRSGRDRATLTVSGMASFAIWPMLLSVGLGRTTASHTALIMALIPVFTVLIAAAVERQRPRAGWWLGSGLAFAGACGLLLGRGMAIESYGDGASVAGDLIVLTGSSICALGYVAGGTLSAKIGTVATTFWGLGFALVALVPTFLLIVGRTVWNDVPTQGWLAIAWLTFLSSLAGYALWFFALGRGGVGRIGSLQLAMPAITLGAAVIILREPLSLHLLVIGALIVVGTFVAQRHAS